jgi:hypothetical protein
VAVEEQMEYLWGVLKSDPRSTVRLVCLKCIFVLSRKNAAHLHGREPVLLGMLDQSKQDSVKAGILAVLAMLARQWKVRFVCLCCVDQKKKGPSRNGHFCCLYVSIKW